MVSTSSFERFWDARSALEYLADVARRYDLGDLVL